MSKIKVSNKFSTDFLKVAKHYMLEELGELETAKQAARNDMENAEVCYAAIVAEISDEIR